MGKSREFPFYGSGPMSDSRIVVFAADKCLELVIRNKVLLTIINFGFCFLFVSGAIFSVLVIFFRDILSTIHFNQQIGDAVEQIKLSRHDGIVYHCDV